jgi:tetratricopeptide (TPR) repeat protein
MKKEPDIVLLICLLLFVFEALSQTDFRAGLEKADPIDKESALSLGEKLKIHQQFYDKALEDDDTLRQLYGLLYLSTDYSKAQDFSSLAPYLLAAEELAIAAGDPGWQGWVVYKKGVLSLRLKNYEDALKHYENAVALCGEVGDSLCMAESLEQASVMYGMLDDFDMAKKVNDRALPLLQKFGGDRQMASALNNFGIILSLGKRPAEAIPYFERSIEISEKLSQAKGQAKAMNNLADAHRKLKQYDLALETFQRCIRFNLENNFPENLIHNYVGMGATYDSSGDYRSAVIYLEKYHDLKDSLIGAETQQKITELEIKYGAKQKELELEKSKTKLLAAQASIEKRNWFIIIGLLIAAFILWRWRLRTLLLKREKLHYQEKLKDLTHILLAKNKQLAGLEEQVLQRAIKSSAAPSLDSFEENLYNQHILTDADWSAFKVYFEKAHPGFLQRVRATFPTLSDAEVRLFLFIKLNLTTKEAATILGISADSVKKTRNRLRKRLVLGEEIDLREFIHSF